MTDIYDWVDWGRLEQRIPLDDLPRFHRAFLTLSRPEEDWEEASLRKVQGKVQASLKQLEREGKAKTEENTLFVLKEVVPTEFRHYINQARGN